MGKTAELKFLITMDMAYRFLKVGTISGKEYSQFLTMMNEKYKCENIRNLYQSLLDIHQVQSGNSNTKGA
jgi:vacuolar-type H+-ATPase subunit C/Vma6